MATGDVSPAHSLEESNTLGELRRREREFLATVSHELRTPLTAILGWAHMLRVKQFDAESTAGALDTIERNARAQSQLIDDLLDVSRIIAGNLRLDVRQVEPGSFIEAAVEALRPAAEARGVRIQKVLDTGVASVAGDPARLQQVVWNLLSNAIKFTPKGGRVQVRLERIDSHIEIAVGDTGPESGRSSCRTSSSGSGRPPDAHLQAGRTGRVGGRQGEPHAKGRKGRVRAAV